MKNVIEAGKYSGEKLAAGINSAFDGDIPSAFRLQEQALFRIASIKDESDRIKAVQIALADMECWLGLKFHLNPIIAGTQEVDPFWRVRHASKDEVSEVTFPVAGKRLAEAHTFLCNNKPQQAIALFRSASTLFSKLPDYEQRHDACSFAHEIQPLSPLAVSTQAWQDIIDATNYVCEESMDLAFVHLEQAVTGLAAIPDLQDRADAVALARQRSIATLSPNFPNKLLRIVEQFVEIGISLDSGNPFSTVLRELVQPIAYKSPI